MAIEIIPIEDRESWLRWRKGDLTGSDIAAIAGWHPYRTALRVYAEKRGLISGALDDNDTLARGRWMEAAIIEAMRERHPAWEIKRLKVYVRDGVLRIGGTPDAAAVAPERDGIGVIEAKVVAASIFRKNWESEEVDEETGEITDIVAEAPAHFQLQNALYGNLMGASWGIVAALVVSEYGAKLREFEVPYLPAVWTRMQNEARIFWQLYDAGRAPAWRAPEDLENLAQIHSNPDPTLPAVDLSRDNEIIELLERRAAAMLAIKAHTATVDTVKTEVLGRLGDATAAIVPGWTITRKNEDRAEHTVAAKTVRPLRIRREAKRKGKK